VTTEIYDPPLAAQSVAPTRTRFIVLAFLCTLAFLLYIDRTCIGQAAQSICRELNLDKFEWSIVINAFTLAYCLFEVPAGYWGDRFGSRGIITRIVVWWSAFTALTGACFSLWPLVGVRFLFGAGEAGAFPNVARVITRWFPPQERGRARGTVTTISLFGGVLAPALFGTLIDIIGWRATFAVFGAVGVVWAILFSWWFRDDPAKHSQVNAAELKLIQVDGEATIKKATHSIPWRYVLMSPNVWLMGPMIMTASSLLFYMLFNWYPTYLKEARGQNQLSSGWMTSAVMLAGAFGAIYGGWLVDFVNRRTTRPKWARRLCGAVPLSLAAMSAYAIRLNDTAAWSTFCSAAALFFVQATIPTWWTVVAEISGRHGAAMWGLMNSAGGLGNITVMFLVGAYLSSQEKLKTPPLEAWQPVFDGVALGLALGALCWMMVDATKSIVGEEK